MNEPSKANKGKSEAAPDVDKLKRVMPENQAAQSKAARESDIPNVSTTQVVPTAPFDSRAYEMANQAKAGFATHLDMVSQVAQPHHLASLRDQFRQTAEQLKAVHLPDTSVNLQDVGEVKIPSDLKMYAIDLNQLQYNQIISVFLGPERMEQLKMATAKANQLTTPALFLNQMIAVECKKPYVFLISRDQPERANERPLSSEHEQKANDYLLLALGPILYAWLAHIAEVNQNMPIYTLFVVLCDVILAQHNRANVAITPQDIWATAEA